ncbi:MAG: hypothetical protein LM550_02915, partial [Candidatus Contendobacter sp.]|nr:hypothetical protein [Candidatus Contendobacter sp.]
MTKTLFFITKFQKVFFPLNNAVSRYHFILFYTVWYDAVSYSIVSYYMMLLRGGRRDEGDRTNGCRMELPALGKR